MNTFEIETLLLNRGGKHAHAIASFRRVTEKERSNDSQRLPNDAFCLRPLIAQKYNLFDGCVIFALLA